MRSRPSGIFSIGTDVLPKGGTDSLFFGKSSSTGKYGKIWRIPGLPGLQIRGVIGRGDIKMKTGLTAGKFEDRKINNVN
jgi:hypothetical protein